MIDKSNEGIDGPSPEQISLMKQLRSETMGQSPKPNRIPINEILSFLEKIGGDGYGGMAEYEIALAAARDLVK